MLTISQLAAYAGVTVRAVRHYHQIGLLPEPERDHSGYRTYDAAAVVRLIRIRTLADAGVPLARVQELLDASPEEFADGVQEIDKDLRAEIRRLQGTRKRLARLAAGEHLALPQSVVDYLDRLRGLGVEERYIELERDAWIMVAAQVPHLIDAVIAKKHEDLDDPDMVQALQPAQRGARLAGRRPTGRRGRRHPGAPDDSRCARPARWVPTASTTSSSTCWTRPWSSPHRAPSGCWRSWRSGAGRAGPASSECLPTDSTPSRDPPRSTHQRCGHRQTHQPRASEGVCATRG